MKFLFFMLSCLVFANFQIRGQGIEDQSKDSLIVIRNIVLVGNKKTKSWVIERELTFARGDTILSKKLSESLERSKNNLRNTSLFTTNDFRFTINQHGMVDVFIVVSERWYVWPQLIFQLAETNFNSWWENKDFSRINYGVRVNHKNFRGRNEEFNVLLQFGFTELISFSYSVPFFNRRKTLGLGVSASFGRNHEVNYNSDMNKRLFYKDATRVQQWFSKASAELRFRPKIFSRHTLGCVFNEVSISDTIKSLNANYLPAASNRQRFASISYNYTLDKRDNKVYALEGWFLKLAIYQYGLGIFRSEIDQTWSEIETKKYLKLAPKFYLSGLLRGQGFFNKTQPYYLRQGLGYSDKTNVRSYELYVIDAQQFAIGKLQLRYNLKSSTPTELEFVPLKKFRKFYYNVYLGVFSDAAYALDEFGFPRNNFANELQYGSGISLDITSVYDMVFRAEYSINKFGEHGLFLHFVAPI
ncbi:MAG: POTRA domain-containing protein [Vicingaceae bacterium]